MSYIFTDTIWPEHRIPVATKELIAKLLELGDTNDPDVGYRMAEEIFTPDGILDHGSYKFEGKKAISNCRSNSKPGSQIIKRRHHISRVYSQTENADDLVVIGELVVEFANSKVVHNKFASRAVIDGSRPGVGPRLTLWAIYIARFKPSGKGCTSIDRIALRGYTRIVTTGQTYNRAMNAFVQRLLSQTSKITEVYFVDKIPSFADLMKRYS